MITVPPPPNPNALGKMSGTKGELPGFLRVMRLRWERSLRASLLKQSEVASFLVSGRESGVSIAPIVWLSGSVPCTCWPLPRPQAAARWA